jgi:hypothetical protein
MIRCVAARISSSAPLPSRWEKPVGIFKEIDVINAITAPVGKGQLPALEPLIRHLETCKNAGPTLCRHLARLLDDSANTPLQLVLKRRDNRRVLTQDEVEGDLIVYHRVQELRGQTIDQTLCRDILRHLPANWTIKHSNSSFLLKKNGYLEKKLLEGKPLSEDQASFIAANQIGKSHAAVKKMIAAVEIALGET